jgi:hypothetical protein
MQTIYSGWLELGSDNHYKDSEWGLQKTMTKFKRMMDVLVDVYMCQNLSNHALPICHVSYTSKTSLKMLQMFYITFILFLFIIIISFGDTEV